MSPRMRITTTTIADAANTTTAQLTIPPTELASPVPGFAPDTFADASPRCKQTAVIHPGDFEVRSGALGESIAARRCALRVTRCCESLTVVCGGIENRPPCGPL